MCSIEVTRARPSTLVEQIVFDKNTEDPSVSTRNCNFSTIFLLMNFFPAIIENEQTVLQRLYHFKNETVDIFNIHFLNFFKEKLESAKKTVIYFPTGDETSWKSAFKKIALFFHDPEGPNTDIKTPSVVKINLFMVLG